MPNEMIESNQSELILYESKDGSIKLDVNLEYEIVSLSIEQMSKLFDDGELEADSTVANFATVRNCEKLFNRRRIDHVK